MTKAGQGAGRGNGGRVAGGIHEKVRVKAENPELCPEGKALVLVKLSRKITVQILATLHGTST